MAEKSVVVIAECDSYEEEKVNGAVRAAVDALGGIGAFVRRDERILVKPNFLYPSESGKHITTHPSVIRAMLRILKENGYENVFAGDSPATGSSEAAWKKLGLDPARGFGFRIAPMNREVRSGRFPFTQDVIEADAIIGVCKMKTHMLERITGAVKNMYGLICGKQKAAGHVSYPTAARFAQYVCGIHKATPQRLHIMDGITAMEGNGPASGTPVSMNVILVSSDPVAVDTVFCRLVNLNPVLVPTNTAGFYAGIGTYKEKDIELKLVTADECRTIGMDEAVKRFGKPDFDVAREKEKGNLLSFWSRLTGSFGRRPVIDPDKCIRCGMCVEHCPVEGFGVSFANGRQNPPVYDYAKCIRCYCCQEICPQHAIASK